MSAGVPHASQDESLVLRPMTGHDRRRLRTKAKLISAARSLVSETGVDGIQVADVTRRAGVGVGSFYNHFDSLDSLVDSVVTEALAELTEAMVSGVAEVEDPAVTVCDAVRRFVRLAYDTPDFATLFINLARVDAIVADAVYPDAGRALRAGVASRRFIIPDVQITLITTLGAALALMRAIVTGAVGEGAENLFAEQTMRGLGVPPDEAHQLVQRALPPLPGLEATPDPGQP